MTTIMQRFTIIVCILLIFHQSSAASDFRFSPKPNKAHLIQWRNWNEETLSEAKKTNRLILLSLSAVWCHWCHVMDETTYSDDKIISLINSNFIPVRVDSDRRPDIDSLYNLGGWPSTVILTPDGDIIGGGNYVPPEEMISLLSAAAYLFKNERQRLARAIEREKTTRAALRKETGIRPGKDEILKMTHALISEFDKENGGFGSSAKFPDPDRIDFLISGYVRTQQQELKTVINKTLTNMYSGDLYDEAEGGFFRYATRPDWSAPHYEKMLDLNAGLIRNYVSAYMVFGNKDYRKIAEKTVRYINQYLYDEQSGAFYGSQDADESYYLSKDRKGLTPPFVDTTRYADSNARMITALLMLYNATGQEKYLRMATKTADFLLSRLYSEKKGVFHYYHKGKKYISGLLHDNVLFGLALVELYNVTGDVHYIRTAERFAHFIKENFYNETEKTFSTSRDTTIIKPAIAGAHSTSLSALANFNAVIFLNKILHYKKSQNLRKIIDGSLARLATEYGRVSSGSAIYGTALRWSFDEAIEITIIADDQKRARFLSEVNKIYVPEKAVKILSLKKDRERIMEIGYSAKEAVYLCSGKRCSAPIVKPEGIISRAQIFLEELRERNE